MQRTHLLLFVFCLVLSSCGPKGPVTLTVMTHDSFAASEPVITAFEKVNNVKVAFLKSGDAGAALNKAILTADAPLADVFYGVDNTFLSAPWKQVSMRHTPRRFWLKFPLNSNWTLRSAPCRWIMATCVSITTRLILRLTTCRSR